jgi:hypothetical protein
MKIYTIKEEDIESLTDAIIIIEQINEEIKSIKRDINFKRSLIGEKEKLFTEEECTFSYKFKTLDLKELQETIKDFRNKIDILEKQREEYDDIDSDDYK